MNSSASSTPGFVADQHGVEHFVAELGQARRDADGLFEQNLGALSAANASASQPPVRCSVVTYSTFIRAGIWPQIFGAYALGGMVAV